MNYDALHTQLGRFVLKFQTVEAAMVELTVQIVNADSEYVATLVAELEFNAKARALDVIYTRHAQIFGLSEKIPHAEFHKLMVRIQKLATRRNDLVHSFYNLLITADGEEALARTPTRLRPSDGVREQEGEDILPDKLEAEIAEMGLILNPPNLSQSTPCKPYANAASHGAWVWAEIGPPPGAPDSCPATQSPLQSSPE
ncbi:hypothetical protein [Acidovorax sp. A1169]|uniref:hypothetical protein n=1 Tax=Acidovorax sp. A1169 TaxID=3059524 RepID=UPI002737BFD9|nr:hypothetical protein [Acidovorax sp. A1169]MDP4074363.1 hypothetical protein [Acidovorax sp. A1169]